MSRHSLPTHHPPATRLHRFERDREKKRKREGERERKRGRERENSNHIELLSLLNATLPK